MSDVWVIEGSTRSLARLDNELRGHLRKKGRPKDEIDSIVSRTWIAAGKAFEGRCSLRNFLFAVMRNTMRDYHRRAKRRPWFKVATHDAVHDVHPDDLHDSEIITPDSTIDQHISAERLRLALSEIPPHYAAVVELVLEGHGNYAIADMLELDYNTVRSRYSRGKAKLLEQLGANKK